jgi:putative FmdB family regulatory protein
MPTYGYECRACGLRFERRQAISEAPLAACPECRGEVRRLLSGGAGFIVRGLSRGADDRRRSACSVDGVGRTCCGREERCDRPPCEVEE